MTDELKWVWKTNTISIKNLKSKRNVLVLTTSILFSIYLSINSSFYKERRVVVAWLCSSLINVWHVFGLARQSCVRRQREKLTEWLVSSAQLHFSLSWQNTVHARLDCEPWEDHSNLVIFKCCNKEREEKNWGCLLYYIFLLRYNQCTATNVSVYWISKCDVYVFSLW